MDREQKEGTAVSRGSNVLHIVPHDWGVAPDFLGPALDRLDDSEPDLQLLALTTNADAAVELIRAVRSIRGGGLSLMAATAAPRVRRILQRGQPQVVAGPPEEILKLIQEAALKLATLKTVVIAWADDLTLSEPSALENILSELPREAARVIVASELTPEVEQLVERYARRARRSGGEPAEAGAVDVEYVATVPQVRPAALRRLLDAIDPASAVVVAGSPAALVDARETVADLGYEAGGAVSVAESPPAEGAELVIFFGLPSTASELGSASRAGARVVVMIQPRQLQSLRRLAGGRVAALALPEAARWARRRDEVVRDELRQDIARGHLWREMVALEPLLAEHDALEVAAAALRLLEQSRRSTGQTESSGRRVEGMEMGRVFVNVGSRDGARPGDLVGALTNEVGVARESIGRIEMRESFSLVEIDPSVIGDVASKLTGVAIRGRRVIARVDQQERRAPRGGSDGGRPARSSAGRSDGPRGGSDTRRPPRSSAGRGEGPRGGSDTRRAPRTAAGRGEGARTRERSGRPPRRPE